MSTRCEIIIKQNLGGGNIKFIKLYHHHDGYPEGVGVNLMSRAQKWGKQGWNIDCVANSLVKDANDEYKITAYKHTDIEYVYFINCDKMSIRCFTAIYDYNDAEGETLLKTLEEKKIPF